MGTFIGEYLFGLHKIMDKRGVNKFRPAEVQFKPTYHLLSPSTIDVSSTRMSRATGNILLTKLSAVMTNKRLSFYSRSSKSVQLNRNLISSRRLLDRRTHSWSIDSVTSSSSAVLSMAPLNKLWPLPMQSEEIPSL